MLAGLAVIRNILAAGLHDLKIVIVHPDAPLEVSLTFFHLLGSQVKDKGVNLVDVLLAGIEDTVLGQVLGGEHKGKAIAKIVLIFLGKQDAGQAGLGSKGDILNASAFVIVGNVFQAPELSIHGAALKGLNGDVLCIGVVVACLPENAFFGGKFLDNFFRSDSTWD